MSEGVVCPNIRVRFHSSDLEAPTLKFTKKMKTGEVLGTLPSKIRKGARLKNGYSVLKCKNGYISYKSSDVRNALSFSVFAREGSNCKLEFHDNLLLVRLSQDVSEGENVIIFESQKIIQTRMKKCHASY